MKIILVWLAFLPIPIINGSLREYWYKQKIGEFGSNIVGFGILSVFFLLFVFLFFKNSITSFENSKLLFMGASWLILTLIFEFGIGLYSGRSWTYMLADYNLLKGRLWPLVLMIIFFSPFIVKYFSKIKF